MQIYCDLDGVLADFHGHYNSMFGASISSGSGCVDWAAMSRVENFYEDMPMRPDARTLWDRIGLYDPVVLTGLPTSRQESWAEHKRLWVARHIGLHVEVICCRTAMKSTYAKPGDILIDDRPKYRELWEGAGGVWITHTTARETLAQLWRMGY